jgi:hypothetical protein
MLASIVLLLPSLGYDCGSLCFSDAGTLRCECENLVNVKMEY